MDTEVVDFEVVVVVRPVHTIPVVADLATVEVEEACILHIAVRLFLDHTALVERVEHILLHTVVVLELVEVNIRHIAVPAWAFLVLQIPVAEVHIALADTLHTSGLVAVVNTPKAEALVERAVFLAPEE